MGGLRPPGPPALRESAFEDPAERGGGQGGRAPLGIRLPDGVEVGEPLDPEKIVEAVGWEAPLRGTEVIAAGCAAISHIAPDALRQDVRREIQFQLWRGPVIAAIHDVFTRPADTGFDVTIGDVARGYDWRSIPFLTSVDETGAFTCVSGTVALPLAKVPEAVRATLRTSG